MGKLISTLMGLLCFLMLPEGNAQSPMDSIDLPTISVMSNRASQQFSEENRSVEIITKSEIDQTPASSVAEVLQYAAGVDIRQRGVHGIQADVSIRGGGFDQVLILLNGVKLYDPQTGHHSLNLPVSLENIERIEILRGSGARAYGQNAFAGAINIVTKVSEENQIELGLEAGDFGSGSATASVNYANDKTQHLLGWSKNFSAGYRYNTDYQLDNYFYQGQRKVGKHKLNWLAGYTERAFGANGFYASPAFTDQYEAIQTSLVSVSAELKQNSWTWKPRLSWRRNQDEYIFVRSNPSIYRNLHISQVYNAELHAVRKSKIGATGIGVEANLTQLFSNNLGNHNRQQFSAFAEHRFQFWNQKLSLSPGLFFNYASDYDVQIYPGLDVGLEMTHQLRLFADIGLTNRIPSFTDLYYEDPANLGNPALQPESALSYDAGIKFHPNAATWISVSAFQRFGRDIIDWTKNQPDAQWQPFNFNQINASGVEASWRWTPRAIEWIQQLKVNYTYLNQEIDLPETSISRYSLSHLKHQLQVGAIVRPVKNMFLSVGARWLDRVSLEDYWIMDTKLSYEFNSWKAFLKVNNLFSANYTETNLVPMPGIWSRVGLSFRLR